MAAAALKKEVGSPRSENQEGAEKNRTRAPRQDPIKNTDLNVVFMTEYGGKWERTNKLDDLGDPSGGVRGNQFR